MKTFSKTLKRVLTFNYEYKEAKSLEEVAERLKRTYQIFQPTKDVLITRSLAEKDVVRILFVLLEENEKGGELVLLETTKSWYNYEKILSSLNAYCINAGIEYKIKKLDLD